jgi:hypothetical protein
MSAYSSHTPHAVPRSGSTRAPHTHYEEFKANARLDFESCLADIFRGTALSDAALIISASAARGIQGPYISLEFARALWNATRLPTPTPSALQLLDEWYSTPSSKPKEYWDGLKAEIAANRFTLRQPED